MKKVWYRLRAAARLVGFEFRKNFMIKPVFVLLAALLAVNAVNIARQEPFLDSNPKYREEYHSLYRELYGQFGGEITAEKVKAFLALYRPIQEKAKDFTRFGALDPDAYFGSCIVDGDYFDRMFARDLEYDYLYQNAAYRAARQAKDNAEWFREKGNKYEAEKNRRIEADFCGRKVTSFCYMEMWYSYLGYDASCLLLLLFCLYAMSGVFVIEKETEMELLLRTAPNGAGRTALAKIAASFLFTCLVCALFWAEDYLAFGIRYGSFSGGSQPLYALADYQYTPLRCSIRSYAILLAALKTAGVWGVCLVYLWLSRIFRTVLLPYLTGLCATAALLFLRLVSLTDTRLKWWNPAELVYAGSLFVEEQFTDWFGCPVRQWAAVLSGVLFVGIFFCFLICLGTGRRRRRSGAWQAAAAVAVFGGVTLCAGSLAGGLDFASKREEAGREDTAAVFLYNSASSHSCEAEGYYLYMIYEEDLPMILEGKETGEQTGARKDVQTVFGSGADHETLAGLVELDGLACSDGRYFYYGNTHRKLLFWNGSKTIQRISVMRMDPRDGSEEVYLELPVSSGMVFLPELGKLRTVSDSGISLGFNNFFVVRDELYLVKEDEVSRYDRALCRFETFVPLSSRGNVACDGESLYCLDDAGVLMRYRMADGQGGAVDDVAAADFRLTRDGIYYTNRRDAGCLYFWDPETGENRRLGGEDILSFECDSKAAYYVNSIDQCLYRLGRDGGSPVRLTDRYPLDMYVFEDADDLYIPSFLEDEATAGNLILVDKETGEQELIPYEQLHGKGQAGKEQAWRSE